MHGSGHYLYMILRAGGFAEVQECGERPVGYMLVCYSIVYLATRNQIVSKENGFVREELADNFKTRMALWVKHPWG